MFRYPLTVALPGTLFNTHLTPIPRSRVSGLFWGCDWGHGISTTEVMALRAHVDEAKNDPDYSIVVSYEAVWE